MTEAEKLRQERDQWKDEALRLREQKTMHMYVWSDEVSFMAIAQAESVQKARLLVLDQIGTDDGSCPERVKARRVVKTVTPGIWYGSNAEFCLRDNAEIREQEAYSAKLFAENEALRLQLAEREKLGVEQANKILRYWEDNEALRKKLRINECDSKRMLAELEEIERNLRQIMNEMLSLIDALESDRNSLRERLESAILLRFDKYDLRRPLGGRWEVVRRNGDCLFCTLPRIHVNPGVCYFDTFEEAEAAAKKALEVAG